MPSGRVHMTIGAGATFALTCALHYPIELIWVGTVASLLPDTDTRKSLMGRWIPVWLFTKHRGFTHSFLGLCVCTFLCFLCVQSVAIASSFFVGYFSHLALDWLTPRGIQWKWPKATYYSLRR